MKKVKYSQLFCRFWRIYEFFFIIPKIQKSYNIHAIFLRVVWWSKRLKWSLKSQKTRFFQAFFRCWKRLEKNVFYATLRTTSIFLIIKLLSKILHGYYTTFVFLEFWKKLINSSKSAKQLGILYFFHVLKEFLDYWKNMLRWDNVTLVKIDSLSFADLKMLLSFYNYFLGIENLTPSCFGSKSR